MNLRHNIILISIGLILSLMLFYSCKNDYQEIMAFANLEQRPEQQAEDIEIVRTDSGKVVFKMNAPILKRFTQIEENPYEEFPEGFTIVTYNNYPKVESSITCKYAIHLIKEDLWEARNDVVAISLEGDTVTTEQLFWDVKAERIYSDKYVSKRNKDDIMQGIGFESNQTLTNVKIHQFNGEFDVNEDE